MDQWQEYLENKAWQQMERAERQPKVRLYNNKRMSTESHVCPRENWESTARINRMVYVLHRVRKLLELIFSRITNEDILRMSKQQ